MTSDAKIGLLLGLVFIFIIAFIINGVPTFNKKDSNNNELTTNITALHNSPPGIGTKERKVSRKLISPPPSIPKQSFTPVQPAETNQDIRFEMPLPKEPAPVEQTGPPAEITLTAAQSPPTQPVTRDRHVKRPRPARAPSPKVYVVREGDSLAEIALKLYGAQEGNRHVNVTRIFQANRKLLKSPDEVYPGQRLTIPPLSASQPEPESIFPTNLFEKVKSIGQKRTVSDRKPQVRSRVHVVREGDSLWQIAADKLGDGSRYNEIAELNGDVIDDEDTLAVGMRLKLPAR